MKWWHFALIGGGVLWYVNEQNRVKLAANRGAEGVVNAAGRGGVKIIDEAAGALGRWFGGLFSGSSPSNTTSSPTYSSGSSAAYTPDGYDSYEDYYGPNQDV